MSQLTATRVLVTGATSGLGRAMARALARAGAEVALPSRDGARAAETARELGERVIGLELDVRDEASVHAAVDAAWERLGAIDMLVNNAGIGMRTVNPRFLSESQPFWAVPPAGFSDVLETKVTGSFLVASAVVPHMLEQGAGRIVNITMNHQTMVRRGFVPYGPAGAAVEALSHVMAAALIDTPITVNMLLPGGATNPGMIPADTPPEVRDGLLLPAIMGPPIVWLASSEAEGVRDQ